MKFILLMAALMAALAACSVAQANGFSVAARPVFFGTPIRDREGALYRLRETNQTRWLIERSVNGGRYWQANDPFKYVPNGRGKPFELNDAQLLYADSSGNIYAAGNVASKSGGYRIHIGGSQSFEASQDSALVRVTRDNGKTWTNLLNPLQVNNQLTRAAGFSVDAAGNYYLLTVTLNARMNGRWTLFKGTPDGKQWTPLDSYGDGRNCNPAGFAVDEAGQNLYVTGFCGELMRERGVTRVSNDGGSSWRDADTSHLSPEITRVFPKAVLIDSARGAIYVQGTGEGVASYVRESTDHGSTWKSVSGVPQAGLPTATDASKPALPVLKEQKIDAIPVKRLNLSLRMFCKNGRWAPGQYDPTVAAEIEGVQGEFFQKPSVVGAWGHLGVNDARDVFYYFPGEEGVRIGRASSLPLSPCQDGNWNDFKAEVVLDAQVSAYLDRTPIKSECDRGSRLLKAETTLFIMDPKAKQPSELGFMALFSNVGECTSAGTILDQLLSPLLIFFNPC